MKYIFLLLVLNAAQYACESTKPQNSGLNISPSNPLNITSNPSIIDECQKPSFANYTIGKKRFIVVDNETLEEYFKTADLTLFEGLGDKKELINWVPPEEIKNDLPWYLSGYDRQNRPIWVSELGRIKFEKYALGGKEKQALFVKYHQFLLFESLKSMAFKSTKENPVHQYILIYDFEGFTPAAVLNPTVLQFWFKIMTRLRHWFRKNIYKNVLLNINQVAEIALNLLRTTVARNVKTFEVYGTNKAFWVQKLIQNYGKDQLPEKYGGCKGFLPIYVE